MKRKATPAPEPVDGPDPADLRWLIRSIELGSMSAAARERNVAVSQVTRALDRLEARLAVRLLRRSTHGLSLTAEGSLLVAQGRDLLARWAALAEVAQRGRQDVAGPVRVAVSAAIADELLVPALPLLLARHPGLRVEIVADDRLSDLPTEGLDIGLRTAVGNSELVVARRLGSFRRALYAAPSYLAARGMPSTPDDLARHVTLTHTGFGDFNRWRFSVDGEVTERVVGGGPAANSTWLIQRMVRAGVGIGLVSMPLAAREVEEGLLVEVLAPFRDPRKLTIYAVALPARQATPRIRAVLDFLAEITAGRWVAR
jgi:DNA-binding transcriptional LysR family regulator